MSLRLKLFIPLIFFGIALTAYVNIGWLPQITNVVEKEYEEQLSGQLRGVAEGIALLIAANELQRAFEMLDTVVDENPDWITVELVDAQGNRWYAARGAGIATNRLDPYTVMQPVRIANRSLGSLVLTVDSATKLRAVRSLQRYFLVAFMIVMLIFILSIALTLELVVRRPVRRLSEASEKMARGDFGAALPKPGGDEVGVLISVFSSMRDAIQRYQTDLSFQTTHDSLTGLVNRREFERRIVAALNIAKSEQSEHVLLYMDLDQFKVVNDTCGHTAGDEYLRQLSAMLVDGLRKHDSLARLGGDEFGVLLEHCPQDRALQLADQLLGEIQDFRFVWEGNSFTLGVSIGLVLINEQSENLSRILKAADAACYAAKDAGRNRIHVYDEDDSTLVRRHGEMQWVSRITEAVEEGRFHLYYQPIVPVDQRQIEGLHMELLLRMEDRHGNIILPGAFLPAAERYNLMPHLDRWVTQTAFEWLAQNPDRLRELKLCTINLSGHSLGEGEFRQFVVEQLQKTGVPADKICFEITETAAIGNLMKATRFMSILRNLGCRFSLDDFGSGMSSFAYLKSLPVDYLKIDGLFVRDIMDDSIDYAMVKSINELGHVMGKLTVAEFVEKESILWKLREIGVDYAQGFGIARPRPLIEMDSTFIRQQLKSGQRLTSF